MNELAKKVIELRLATRRATMCENADKSTMNMRTKVLYVLSKKESTAPFELIDQLKINKTNLAALTKELEALELITKTKDVFDKREVALSITLEGVKYLEERLSSITSNLSGEMSSLLDQKKLIDRIDEVLHILDFISIK